VGEESDPFPSSDGNVYVIKINGTTPPKLKPLSEVRAQAVAAWTADWEKRRLSVMAKELVAAASAGKSLAPVATKVRATVQSTGALSRNAPTPTLTPEAVAKLFDSPPGAVFYAPTKNGDGVVIARITGIAHPPRDAADFTYERFARNMSSEAAGDFDSALAVAAREKLGVTLNQSQVEHVTGGS
jgi:peptidyl-prolyl cis-trans isomerase D